MTKVGYVPLAEFEPVTGCQIELPEPEGGTRTFDVAKALKKGKGKVVTEDPLEQAALDGHPVFKRSTAATRSTSTKPRRNRGRRSAEAAAAAAAAAPTAARAAADANADQGGAE